MPTNDAKLAPWIWALVALAALQAAFGLFGAILATVSSETIIHTPIPSWVYAINIAVFGLAAAVLLLGSDRDQRAHYLGAVLCLSAAAFSEPPLHALSSHPLAVIALPARSLVALALVAFQPYFFARFAAEFPRLETPVAQDRWLERLAEMCLFFAIGLLLLSLLPFLVPATAEVPLLSAFMRSGDAQFFWLLVFAPMIPAAAIIAWKSTLASRGERRRVRLFVAGLVVAAIPLFVEISLEQLVPSFGRFMSQPAVRRMGGLVIYPLILSIPISMTYAVLVRQALDVRLVLRRALRYALARYAILAIGIVPMAAVFVYFYSRRELTVSELFSEGRGIAAITAVGAVLLLQRLRRPILEGLDRRFFREQYDSERILSELVEKTRFVEGTDDLVRLITEEIDRALHLRTASLMVRDPSVGLLVAPDGGIEPLEPGSALVSLLASSSAPLEIGARGGWLDSLPEDERSWIDRTGVRLLLPLLSSGGELEGLIALGEKRSELPFSREDKSLLGAIAASSSSALEVRLLRSASVDRSSSRSPEAESTALPTPSTAKECARCGRLFSLDLETCQRCGVALEVANVPLVLGQKFRFERRLGAGGMGVVYLATDILLGRRVAIKTLPRMSPDRALRLHREARAMASVSHPNLALILGAETFKGTPFLVLEFLRGGTLRDRLARSLLSPTEAVELGIILAGSLAALHQKGILHRDIKPSNIGFSENGTPKLMDFGLARILLDERHLPEGRPGARAADQFVSSAATLSGTLHTENGQIVGTPLYLSPEAIRGMTPNVSFDIWSFGVVLFESISGKRPLRGVDVKDTLNRIRREPMPSLLEFLPECPRPVADLVARILHRDFEARPATAVDLLAELEAVRNAL